MAGKLYGIGVGPGDPELLTVKAVEILTRCDHIFTPIAKQGDASVAFDIARKFIPAATPVARLLFPMIKDKQVLERQWMENHRAMEKVVRAGHACAFITLGDSGTYSTFSVVMRYFKRFAPDIEVEAIPGITSFAYAAARAGMPLVEGNEIVSVVSANDSQERLERIIDSSDNVVFLKTYRQREQLLKMLKDRGLADCCTYLQKCGLQGERVTRDLDGLTQSPEYLSLVILKKPRAGNDDSSSEQS
jgi:precorrin-2/cobalt-factor-2 C20-methyltransferase